LAETCLLFATLNMCLTFVKIQRPTQIFAVLILRSLHNVVMEHFSVKNGKTQVTPLLKDF